MAGAGLSLTQPAHLRIPLAFLLEPTCSILPEPGHSSPAASHEAHAHRSSQEPPLEGPKHSDPRSSQRPAQVSALPSSSGSPRPPDTLPMWFAAGCHSALHLPPHSCPQPGSIRVSTMGLAMLLQLRVLPPDSSLQHTPASSH